MSTFGVDSCSYSGVPETATQEVPHAACARTRPRRAHEAGRVARMRLSAGALFEEWQHVKWLCATDR